jgi:preprotein translocase subunit Sss1
MRVFRQFHGEVRRMILRRTRVHTAPRGPVRDPFLSAASRAALGLLRCSRGNN